MRRNLMLVGIAVILGVLIMCSKPKSHPVYMGNEMSYGYDLGVTTNNEVVGWLFDEAGSMKMEYPAGQEWGSAFVTVGKIKDLPLKPTLDVSAYKKISFELKSSGTEFVLEVAIKDAEDLDDGSETRVPISVTNEWQTYEIELSEFKTADLTQVYILLAFIFNSAEAQTVNFRNIQFK